MTNQEIAAQIAADLKVKKVWVESKDGYRCYTDGKNSVPITTTVETVKLYYETFIKQKSGNTPTNNFDTLYKCNIFVGKPDSGKTYKAERMCMEENIPYILIPCRDSLNLETLLEDFTLVDGKPVFTDSLSIKFMSDKNEEKCCIVLDEFNTLTTGVMKMLQPMLDNTSTCFEYKGHVYKKNPNCKFVLTMNDKDKGISVLPDAILSRSKIVYFEQPDNNILAQWTNTPIEVVNDIYNIYKTLGLLPIFGTRQISCIKQLKTIDNITSHFLGLCSLRGMNIDNLRTVEIQRLFGTLCLKL